MATVTRRIGLSLGADVCWPKCFEDILADLDLAIPMGRDTLRFEVERVTIEPFDLQQSSRYDLVIDRLTHWYSTSREWIKKIVLMDGVYVFNNPWSVQSMEKQSTYCAMMDLGMAVPRTWLVPPKEYDERPDLRATLERYARWFDLADVGRAIGYPMFMKPYDGGGWVGVSRIDDERELREAYDKSGKYVMHLQAGVDPYEEFVRCIGMGPQVRIVRYDPSAPLHERYRRDRDFLEPAQAKELADVTLAINAFFGWDFNSCEALRKDGVWHPIDFANPCPDSQITSLNVHFPWLIQAKLRWAIFCAATLRPMRATLDWAPFYEVRDRRLPRDEAIAEYGRVARERFESERFEDFCAQHLAGLERAVWDYFGDDRARQAIARKVEALFPRHEWESFSDYFWEAVQEWRAAEAPLAR